MLYLIRNSQVFDSTASDEALWHLPKPVPILQKKRAKICHTVPTELQLLKAYATGAKMLQLMILTLTLAFSIFTTISPTLRTHVSYYCFWDATELAINFAISMQFDDISMHGSHFVET